MWRWLPAVCIVVFAAVAVVLPGVGCHDYLRKVEEQSFFMGGSWYFGYCLSEPAGLINWCANYLTQFFYYPWLGACIFAVLLAGLWVLIAKAFGIPRSLFGMASVPSCMMLLFGLMPGYLIYMSKTPGFFYTGLLGFGLAAAVYLGYKAIPKSVWRAVVAVAVACTYPLFGFFALFAVVLCIVGELAGRRAWWVAIVGAAAVVVIPQVWFYFAESHTMLVRVYTHGLPRMSLKPLSVMNPYWVTIFAMLLFAAFSSRWANASRHGSAPWIGLAVFVASLASVFVFRYKDANYNTAISMDLAINDGDIKRALSVARAQKETPTRVVDMMTHIALYRDGTAGDSLFTFRMADAPYNSPYPNVALRMSAARMLNYYFGRLNDSYRWCMEDMVEYGYKVEYLKYMVRCALVNEEYELARRYLRMLEGTTFHKDWARKYMAYADNPALMDADPEIKALRPLTAYNSRIGGDSGLIELYISMSISGMRGGPPPLVELSLQFNLIQKNIENFWPRFILYARTHDRLPKHYQEAALLYSTLENKVNWRQFKIDPAVVNRFSQFMDMARRNSRYSDQENRELFEPIFGDTFWFYYFFVNDLKTT